MYYHLLKITRYTFKRKYTHFGKHAFPTQEMSSDDYYISQKYSKHSCVPISHSTKRTTSLRLTAMWEVDLCLFLCLVYNF